MKETYWYFACNRMTGEELPSSNGNPFRTIGACRGALRRMQEDAANGAAHSDKPWPHLEARANMQNWYVKEVLMRQVAEGTHGPTSEDD